MNNGTKNIQDAYRLSPLQEGLIFHSLSAPETGVYIVQITCRLSRLNVAAFEAAWQRVIERHTALRTAFVWKKSEQPLQVVVRRVSLPLRTYDWRSLSAPQQQEKFESHLEADRLEGFSLNRAPLMRLMLFRVGDDSYRLLWSHHHLILDGWSVALLLKEVFTIYEGLSGGQHLDLPPSRPYRDYIAWLQHQDLSLAASYWQHYLKGFSSPTPLPSSRTAHRPSQSPPASSNAQRQLSASQTASLQSLARRHRLTVNTLVQGAWALLLSRYSGDEDVVFGATVSGRPAEIDGVEQMVGLFINTLPVRVRVRKEEKVIEWLERLQAEQVEQRQYEYSPLVEVQGWSEVQRGRALFESIVVFENYPLDTTLQERDEGVEIRDVDSVSEMDFPLTLTAMLRPDLSLRADYDRELFEEATITRLLSHFETLLSAISSATAETRLAQLSLLSESERQRLLSNQTGAALPTQHSVLQLFEEQAERFPEAVALSFEGGQMSYAELNGRANRLARYLREQGVGPERIVALLCHRSPELVVSLLAVLKAGGAFLPLDPLYPPHRLAFMLEDSGASWLLTQSVLAEKAALLVEKAAIEQSHLLFVEELDAEVKGSGVGSHVSDANLMPVAKPENAAYLIYTSGSTGSPKGVIISHHNLLCYSLAALNALQLQHSDRF
ncbi:MAG TPA: condensation domain-containing protein, partial [Pyrinomonadaceae bacterium]